MARSKWKVDPRTGLLLLVLANVIAFSSKSLWVELGTLGLLLFLIVLYGQFRSALKWCGAILGLFALQWYILPASPKIIATSFSIFANYARQMLPCLMISSLLISTLSLREVIVALAVLSYSAEADYLHLGDAAVFSRHQRGNRAYSGCHASAEHPGR